MSVWWAEWRSFEEAVKAMEKSPAHERLGAGVVEALAVVAADPAVTAALATVQRLEADVRACAARLDDAARALAQCASDVRDAAAGPERVAGFVDLEGILGAGTAHVASAITYTRAVEKALARLAGEASAAWRGLRALVDGGVAVFAPIAAELGRADALLARAARLREQAAGEALSQLSVLADRELFVRRDRLRALHRLDHVLAILDAKSPTRAWTMHTLETLASSTHAPLCDSLAPCQSTGRSSG